MKKIIVPQNISQKDWEEIVACLGKLAFHYHLQTLDYEEGSQSYEFYERHANNVKRLIMLGQEQKEGE